MNIDCQGHASGVETSWNDWWICSKMSNMSYEGKASPGKWLNHCGCNRSRISLQQRQHRTSHPGRVLCGSGRCFLLRISLDFCRDIKHFLHGRLGTCYSGSRPAGAAIPFLARSIGVFNENGVFVMLKKCSVSI